MKKKDSSMKKKDSSMKKKLWREGTKFHPMTIIIGGCSIRTIAMDDKSSVQRSWRRARSMSSSLECIAGFLTDGPQYRGSCTTGYPAEIEGPVSIPGSGGPGCPGGNPWSWDPLKRGSKKGPKMALSAGGRVDPGFRFLGPFRPSGADPDWGGLGLPGHWILGKSRDSSGSKKGPKMALF